MRLLLAALLSLIIFEVNGSPRGSVPRKTTVAFYNLENLYDTIPNPFTDDADYTPNGKYRWGAERYTEKLRNISQVIDEINADVIGISEIESERAVRELVLTLKTDYNYIHRTSNDSRGMDLALLYKGDKFTPQSVQNIRSTYSRDFLYVSGSLLSERVDIVVCHLPSNFNSHQTRSRVMGRLASVIDSLQSTDRQARVILMGDFNANPTDKIMSEHFNKRHWDNPNGFMFNPFYGMNRRGMGTYVYNDRWELFDNIIVSSNLLSGNSLRYYSSGIYIQSYMLDNGRTLRRGYPLRTFMSEKYLGGYSDHLPVYIILER